MKSTNNKILQAAENYLTQYQQLHPSEKIPLLMSHIQSCQQL